MKLLRRIFLLMLTFCILFGASGCGILSVVTESYEQYEREQEILYVAFADAGEDGEPFDYREIADYRSEFSAYNSHILYDTLTPAEQQIYRFFEYAMDHGYTSVFMDSRLLAEAETSIDEILDFLSMDSPFVQQNYEYTTYETDYTFSYLYDYLTFEITGIELESSLFDKDSMDEKKEALAAAETLVQSLPEGLSDLEKARYFYRYLTGEVTYRLYEEGEEPHYLYDALCKKETQCDGFANAFSLLCSLSEIPCVEKIWDAETEGESGHTWNAFLADGVWYNADCALDPEFAKEQKEFGVDFLFGFSDEREDNASLYAERLSACITEIYPVNAALPSSADPAFLSQIGKAFDTADSDWILIRLEEGELTEEDFQQIADYMQSDLYSMPEVWSGKNYYYLFLEE